MTENTDADREEETDDAEKPDAMDDPLRDAETIVAAFGGVRPMASRLGIAATTIQGWKSRGRIPENRRQAVLDAVEADGIDLFGLLQDVPAVDTTLAPNEPPDVNTVEAVAAVDTPRQVSNGVAWLALIFAIAVGAGLLTQPQWTHFIHGVGPGAVPEALVDRVAALEKRPTTPNLTDRVSASERALGELKARKPVSPGVDLTPELRALTTRVEALAQALGTARLEGRAANEGRATDLTELRAAVDALSLKIKQAVVDTAQTNARKSSVLVAVGALEVALGDGLPYGHALDAVRQLAESSDAAYTESAKILKADAVTGIPTRSQLLSRLDALIAARGKPLWKAETDSWTDRVLRKVDAVISIRRIDDSAGPADGLHRARKTLAANDLQGAAGELKGATGDAGIWARDALRRIAGDQAFLKLRLWAIKALDSPATAKPSAQ